MSSSWIFTSSCANVTLCSLLLSYEDFWSLWYSRLIAIPEAIFDDTTGDDVNTIIPHHWLLRHSKIVGLIIPLPFSIHNSTSFYCIYVSCLCSIVCKLLWRQTCLLVLYARQEVLCECFILFTSWNNMCNWPCYQCYFLEVFALCGRDFPMDWSDSKHFGHPAGQCTNELLQRLLRHSKI